MAKYYSTQRPIMPGSFPKPINNVVDDIVNFDQKKMVESIGMEAWGYVEYRDPLTRGEYLSYELTPDREQGGGGNNG